MSRFAGALFVGASALAAGVAWLPLGWHGAGYIAANVVATVALFLAWRAPSARWVLFSGIIARLVLLAVPPYTTHDVMRYMFDGAIALAGFDPYSVASGDPRLAFLQAVWPTAIEHAKYPTIYPPLALAVFASCAKLGPTWAWLAWKALVTAASVGIVVVARRIVSDPRGFVLIAFSPLLLFEGGIGAHLDIMCALTVMLALGTSRLWLRGAWLGVGVLWKLTPVFLLVPLVWQARRRAFELLVGFLLVVVPVYVLANQLGYESVGSLRVFFAKWSFGSPWLLVEDMVAMSRPWLLRIAAVVTLLMLAWSTKAERPLLVAASAPLIASPVVFPWYLCTVAALLALEASPYALAWTLTMPLTYEVIDRFDVDGSWFPALWPVQLTLVLVGALLLQRREMLGRPARS